MGQCSLLEFLWERKFPGDIFLEKVSLNRPNHLTTVQIFQLSQSTSYVANTNHSSLYKSFNVVKIHSASHLQAIQRCTNHSTFSKS